MRVRRLSDRYGWSPFVGALAVVSAVVCLSIVSWRAIVLTPLPHPLAAAGRESASSAGTEPREPVTVADLYAKNPFHPERRGSDQRYELPTGADQSDGSEGAIPAGALTLAGTILYPDGGGAAIVKQVGQASQIVRQGMALGTLTLQSVERGKATFTASDGSPVILVSSEGRASR